MQIRKTFLLLLIVAIALGTSFAQTIPTGKLTGTVTDAENGPMPGVNVTISSPALILPQMSSVTNEKGLYKFFNLPSGAYKVTFELQGFKGVVREDILISATHTTTLDIVLEQGALENTLTIVGQSPTVDMEKTQTGTTFTKDLINNLPLTRDLSSIFNAAPGMFARTSHGSDARSNDFVVDGVKMQDPVTGDPYQTVPWNAIDEVEIETSNQKAEYGAVKGALVQVITKAGGNAFTGGVNFYFRNKSLQSDNTKGTPLAGKTFVGFKNQYIPGFSLGGPIKKDKLWFFASFDVDTNQSYIQGFPAPETIGGAQPASVTSAKKTYAPFFKLTWQPDKTSRVVASGYFRKYNDNHRDASRWTTVDANANEDTAVGLGTVQWTKTVSNSLFVNLKGSYYMLNQYILARNALPPYVELSDGIVRGGYGSDWWYRRRRFQANSDLTYFADDWFGSHEFKAGVSVEFANDSTEDKYYPDTHLAGVFPAGFKSVDVQLWEGVPLWTWVGTEFNQKNRLTQVGGFMQDTWSPAKQVTVNLGFRYDFAQGAYPPQKKKGTNEWVNQNTVKAMTFNMFSPRFGISYDPFGNGKTVIRANFGRYYAPLIMIYYYFNNPNQRTSFWANLNPDWTVNYTTPPWTPGLNSVDKDIRSPYADEINVGIERELFENFSVAATFLAKWEKNLIDDVESHVDIAKWKATGDMVWSGYHPVTGTDPFTGNPVTFYEMNSDFGNASYVYMNIPGTARKYRGLEFKAIKRMSNHWAMQASYVWSRGEGILNTSRDQSTGFSGYYDDPNVMINASGRLDYQREHLVKVQATYQGPWGINVGAFYQFGSGIPYTRQIRTYEAGLGDLYQGGVTINAEKRGTYLLPSQHLLDIRAEKAFNVSKGQIAFQVDVYNVFNNNVTTGIGNLTNFDWFKRADGQRVYSIMGPRYVQLGLVYRF
jgi:Carboxypeptidase regulatory-like domain